MKNIEIGIVMIAAGCALAIFREKFVRAAIQLQKENFGFKYQEKSIRRSILLAPVFGLLFVVYGILLLIGVVD